MCVRIRKGIRPILLFLVAVCPLVPEDVGSAETFAAFGKSSHRSGGE